MKEKRTTLIITGMHRSGTSLLANWLHHLGLVLGDLLIEGGIGNEGGHFEDWDFVHFHNDLLHFNGIDYLGDARLDYEINSYFQQRADNLIDLKNKLHPNWGWKDPRTCLFLNLWHQKTINPRYIFVIRPYAEIAESLYRREVDKLRNSKIYPLKKLKWRFQKKKWIKKYIISYINHNKRIISFCQQLPKDQYLVISRSAFIEKHDALYHHLKNEWNISLRQNHFDSVYKADLAHDLSQAKHKHLAAQLVEQNLKQLEAESLKRISLLIGK